MGKKNSGGNYLSTDPLTNHRKRQVAYHQTHVCGGGEVTRSDSRNEHVTTLQGEQG